MRLIDCFSDVFTFTLHFLDAVESAPGGSGRLSEPDAPAPTPAPRPVAPKPAASPAPTGLAALLSSPVSSPPPGAASTAPRPVSSPAAEGMSARAGAGTFSFEMVRDSYHRLFAQSQELCQRGHVPQADFDLAKFAVCAWVDERISCSAWPERMRWPKEELQRVFFQTTNAGEEFYQYLSQITMTQKDVLEVYATCLSLGFQGRYFGKYGQDELEGIRLSTVRRLLGQSPDARVLGQASPLFPAAYAAKDASASGGAKRALAALAWVGISLTPLVLLLVLFVAYSSVLNSLLAGFAL